MKHFFHRFASIVLLAVAFIIAAPLPAAADEPEPTPITFPIGKKKKGDGDNGQKIPSKPMLCTISKTEGIEFGIDKSEIESYEIWDIETVTLLAAYADEAAFVEYIFAINEPVQVLIETADYYYIGVITH